jgi:hypothetical protein
MSDELEKKEGGTPPTTEEVEAALEAVVHGPTFGPLFFEKQLAVLVSEQTPEGHTPNVRFHLGGGDVLEVGRILGLTLRWIAVLVHDDEDGAPEDATRTEIVPYGMISRITIASTPPDTERARIGFRQESRPPVLDTGKRA